MLGALGRASLPMGATGGAPGRCAGHSLYSCIGEPEEHPGDLTHGDLTYSVSSLLLPLWAWRCVGSPPSGSCQLMVSHPFPLTEKPVNKAAQSHLGNEVVGAIPSVSVYAHPGPLAQGLACTERPISS